MLSYHTYDLDFNAQKLDMSHDNVQPPDDEDMEFSREDLEIIKVIGKGSGGIVQLVQHKLHGTFYALKVHTYQSFLGTNCSIVIL